MLRYLTLRYGLSSARWVDRLSNLPAIHPPMVWNTTYGDRSVRFDDGVLFIRRNLPNNRVVCGVSVLTLPGGVVLVAMDDINPSEQYSDRHVVLALFEHEQPLTFESPQAHEAFDALAAFDVLERS